MRRTIAQTALVFTSALLIMALVGCGGSSKQTTVAPNPQPDPAPTPAPDPPAAISGLPTGHTLTAGTTIAAGATAEILAYSKGQSATITCPTAAGAAGCVVSENADGALVATGEPEVTVTTNQMIWQANNGPGGTSDGAHAAGLVDRLVAASSVLDTPASSATLGEGSVQGTVAQEPTPNVAWTKANPTWELTLPTEAFSGLSGLDADTGELSVDSSSVTPPALGRGWRGASLSKNFLVQGSQTGKAMHAVVYTNMEEPDGYTAGTPKRSVAAGLDLTADPAVVALFGATAPTRNVEVAIPSSGIGTDVKFTIPSAQFETLRGGGALTMIPGVMVTYTDAQGEERTSNVDMSCVADSCRGVTGSNPRLTGTWDIDIPAGVEVEGTQDTHYHVLGSWLVLPGDSGATGETAYNLGSFAYSSVQPGTGTGTRRSRANLTASLATDAEVGFTGRAAGLYMTGSYRGSGQSRSVASAEVGSFLADVKLTLKANNSGTFSGVEGTVSNFTNDNNRSLGWMMSLGNAVNDPAGASAATDEVFVGDTLLETPGGLSATGKWSSQFYYDPGAGLGGQGAAAGTFSAATDNSASPANSALHVVGAFSAANDDAN